MLARTRMSQNKATITQCYTKVNRYGAGGRGRGGRARGAQSLLKLGAIPAPGSVPVITNHIPARCL